ncbi:carotenoid cleavage dioxygenase [Catenuloplanes nepalensis]|uniref:Dioxygenase n=1 Tax=Catenuloplanes nepalensis TaxID=587533 RepID=A0ABT9MP29_9ACTN|nr:carotenoid oxygenase family protein [Catenuloplanes nepalensis]MDP9793157.1 carotenoid cleavage dioxygenase [Catenuloplanes nepalensis]
MTQDVTGRLQGVSGSGDGVMAAFYTAGAPLHVTGHLAPVPDEIDAFDLPVEGTLPPELVGRLLRNGPNPLPGAPSQHWLVGHGMVHGIRLDSGRAKWYRNRWVRTKALAARTTGQSTVGPDGEVDRTAVEANTSVIAHGGKILTLVESGFPHVLSPELETLGVDDFGGRLTTAMTAHPKADPVTGELHFFGYGVTPPFLTYHKLSAAGELVTSAAIDVPGPTMMHDFAITDQHAVFLDLPMTFNPKRTDQAMPFDWDESYGARIGLMPLARPGEVRWFDVDPSYVFHVGNAHTDAGGRVVLDAARYSGTDAAKVWGGIGDPRASTGIPGHPDPAAAAANSGMARLHRWVIDPHTGTVTETTLDDRGIEFPTINDDHIGRVARYRYAVSGGGPLATAIVKLDAGAGVIAEHRLGPDVVASEAVFVPAQDPHRAEDDGWLLSIASRRDGGGSKLIVLDATDIGGKPVASVTLPRRVPTGFHGSWITDRELQ